MSNSLLLASHSQDGQLPVYNIKDSQFSTIELLPCLPRIEKLDTILNPTMYTGPENESAIQAKVNVNADMIKLCNFYDGSHVIVTLGPTIYIR